MKITDALIGEHAALRVQCARLDEALNWADSMAQVEAIATLLEAVTVSHADLEDELLFDELATKLTNHATELTDLKNEHQEIRRLFSRLRTSGSIEESKKVFQEIAELLITHSDKEEEIWFPLAVEVFSEGELERRAETWAERRGATLS